MADRLTFERWLKGSVKSALLSERRRLHEKDEDEEKDVDDEESKGDDADTDADAGESDAEPAKQDNRGGQQQAAAARRTLPPPEPDDLTIKMIVDKLNAIRSGKSFKDQDVRKRIAEYFGELTAAQRLALYAFLEGLAEIIAAGVSGDDARAPNDPDIGVDMGYEGNKEKQAEVPEPTVQRSSQTDSTDNAKSIRRKSFSADVPAKSVDADDDAPVLVVKR